MPENLAELLVTDGLMEAEIIRAKLDSFGIPCMLKFESVGRLLAISMNGLGKVRIMVPPDRLEEARELMAVDVDNGEESTDSDNPR
ncbi:MAG TPA: DUF2007 domain-containing protein [Candidatus Aminicenantes bacterium]|nr:DUF2007 domain-containing protein [Candidatus Aminicenantes bacterium]